MPRRLTILTGCALVVVAACSSTGPVATDPVPSAAVVTDRFDGEIFLPASADVQLLRSGEARASFAVSCEGFPSLRLAEGVTVAGMPEGVVESAGVISFPAGSAGYEFEVRIDDAAMEVMVRCLPKRFPRIETEGTFSQWLALTMTNASLTGPSYQVLLDSSGFPVWFRPAANSLADFTVQDGGLLGFNRDARLFYAFSNTPGFGFSLETFDGVVRDSWIPREGLGLDFHAGVPLPNGNLLAILYEESDAPLPAGTGALPFEGSPYGATCPEIAPSPTTATLRGRVAEVAPDGSFVHVWNVEDYLPEAPTSAHWVDLDVSEGLRCVVDAEHLNGLSFYPDTPGSSTGRVLVTGRHSDGAKMITWPEGDVLWTLGGAKTQYSLRVTDDPFGGPLHPHDANLITDDLLLIYDNRVPPQPSRGLVYRLDVAAGTATLLESYGRVCGEKPCSAFAMGSSRPTLDGSGIVIGWGTEAIAASEFARYAAKPRAEVVVVGNWVYRVLPIAPLDHRGLFDAQNRLVPEKFATVAPAE